MAQHSKPFHQWHSKKKKRNLNLIKSNSTVLHTLDLHFIKTTLYLERELQFVVEACVGQPARLPAGFPRSPPSAGEAKKNNRKRGRERWDKERKITGEQRRRIQNRLRGKKNLKTGRVLAEPGCQGWDGLQVTSHGDEVEGGLSETRQQIPVATAPCHGVWLCVHVHAHIICILMRFQFSCIHPVFCIYLVFLP